MRGVNELDDSYYLVRKDTSEVVDENKFDETFVKIRAGDIILRKDGLSNKPKLSKVNMRYGKMNLDTLWYIHSKYPIFFKMIQYLQYQSGKLSFNNGKDVNKKHLSKLCNLSKNTIDKQIKGLIEEDIIKGVKNGRSVVYFVNPYVVHIGSQVHDSLIEMFKDSSYKRECYKLRSEKNNGI